MWFAPIIHSKPILLLSTFKYMKKHIFILSLAALCLVAGCSKEKRCKCTSLEVNDINKYDVFYVKSDPGLSCKGITRMGFERQLDGSFERTFIDVNCEEVKD